MGRGVSAVLAAALSLLAPAAARAGLTSSDAIGSGDVGKTLKNNTVYVVPSSTTLARTTPYAALYVKNNTTAVIYIPKNVTLTVNGGEGGGPRRRLFLKCETSESSPRRRRHQDSDGQRRLHS